MIPIQTKNVLHKQLTKNIIEVFSLKLFRNDHEEKIKYEIIEIFIDKLAVLLLKSDIDDIENYLQPIIENFQANEFIAKLLTKVILEQDRLEQYENFWKVWELFEPYVILSCKDGDYYGDTKQIIQSYLLVFSPYGEIWKDTAVSWHTLKANDKRFFKRMSESIGHCPTTLYSISKFLTSIGTEYLNDGILWISGMLRKEIDFSTDRDNLQTNTIFYLEKIIRKYIFNNIQQIKEEKKVKEDVLVILDFLIYKGSSLGYMLREKII